MPKGNPNWIKAKEERLAAEAAASSHTIYADGSYSNEPSAVVKLEPVAPVQKKDETPKVELGQLVVFGGPYAKSGYVYQIEEGGFWTRPDKNHAPDLMHCNFWSWDYVKQHMKGGV